MQLNIDNLSDVGTQGGSKPCNAISPYKEENPNIKFKKIWNYHDLSERLVGFGKTLSVPNGVQDAQLYIQFVLVETGASKIPTNHPR